MTEIQVAAGSRPRIVADSIVNWVRGHGSAVLVAGDAGAVNQAVKAVTIAIGFLSVEGIRAVCIPTFADVEAEGTERRTIQITVEVQQRD